jgi:PEGA domain
VGTENLKPLDELKSLDRQIESVQELAGLKPIFFRLEEVAKANVNDFDVQLAVGDIKQHLVNRGTKLRETTDARPVPAAAPPPPPVQAPPHVPTQAPPPPQAPMGGPPIPASTSPRPPSASPPVPPPLGPPRPPVGPPGPPITPPGMMPSGPWATTENTPPIPPPPAAPVPPAPFPFPPASGGPPPLGPPPAMTTKPVAVPPAATKPEAKPPVKPAVKQQGPPSNWKRAVLIGSLVGVVLVAAIAAGVVVHKRRLKAAVANALIQVQIATTPSGASVQVNGEAQCTSDCSVALAPGNYQITAFLEGYEPAASGIAVGAGQLTAVNLTLEPQAQSLRIITDLDQGKVTVDDEPPADLQEGQYILDRLLPGQHMVKVTGKTGEASFSFEIADAKQPTITGPVTARNLDAVVVASLANHAHVLTSTGPMKLAVNGQPEQDTGPAGVDLKSFQAGVDELVLGEGKDQHSVKENFGPAPMLTAFLKSDLNAGTLVVSTGEDDVRVFLNNKEYPRRTQRGQIRIQTIGPVQVRVAKDGFDAPPVQSAEVKKGAETRLEFKLNAQPRFATLQITGGTPGALVSVDLNDAGAVAADGSLTDTNVSPGDHTIEIQRDGYVGHRLSRTFKAGQTVTISGTDAVLAANPAPAPTVAKKVETAPPPPKKEAAPAAPQAGTMADWENPAAWTMEGGAWVHKGAGFVPYKLTPKGTFTFTVQLVKGGGFLRSGHIRWALNYKDAKNYAFYEMDNKNFWAKVMTNGKTFERTHTQLKDLEKQKSFTIQIDVSPEHVVHKMFSGGDWINLDSWAETGRNFSEGKFGFLVQGSEEISLSDFKFQPK